MCGIAGVFLRSQNGLAAEYTSAMIGALKHRGPDGTGIHSGTTGLWSFALGHTRLAIIDLSDAGRQPMVGHTGAMVTTFNGEIYNFLDLRRELEAAGHRFSSQTDTEVILAAYSEWGEIGFRRFRGMFSFAIWDAQRQQLVLARDRWGIKPFYYYERPGMIVFASEIRALLATGLVPRRLDPCGLQSYVSYGSVQEPDTIVDGVRILGPGCGMVVTFNEEAKSRHFCFARPLSNVPADPAPSYQEAVGTIRRKLLESVRHHLVSDVPVGIFLSGGIDSSAIVALVCESAPEPPQTYSVVFGQGPLCEAQFSRRIAEKHRTRHHEIVLTESHLLGALPDSFAAMDQPSVDGTNTYVISKVVSRSGLKVAISGLGADELFGGYPSFARAHRLRLWSPLLRVSRPFLSAIANRAATPTWKRIALASSAADPLLVYEASRRLLSPADVRRLLADRAESEPYPLGVNPEHTTVSAYEIVGYMRNTLLRDTYCMSMAHGLEVRVPFIDNEVSEYVYSLPDGWKGTHPVPKRLLVDAMADGLPAEIIHRPKRGFTLPFERWLHTALKPELEKVFTDSDRIRPAGLSPAAVIRLWEDFREGRAGQRWGRVWALYALLQWCDVNGMTAEC